MSAMGMEIEPQAIMTEGQSAPSSQKEYRETAERFVAFLDIMGFKERVARTGHDDLLSQLTAFIRDISLYIEQYKDSELQLAQFSDSIILFSKDDSTESLTVLAEAASVIMRTAVRQERPIPLKGAIAKGCITCDFSKQLFFGQALIDAFLLEENINYYGVLVHHSAESTVLGLGETKLFKDVKASLKSGNISHYELSWYVDGEADSIEKVESALRDIRLSVSDAPRKYIDNTLAIIKEYYR